jgi:hypothetical protein
MDAEIGELPVDQELMRPAMKVALWWYLGIALLVPAFSILFHEMGHWGAHAAFGFETNRISYGGVSVGSPPTGVNAQLADGLSFAAGTGMSFLLMTGGVLSVVIVGANPVGLGLVLFECVRAVLSFVMGIGAAGWVGVLGGKFGELRYLVSAFDGPSALRVSVAWIELVIPFVALGFVLRRFDPGQKLFPCSVAIVGLVVGLILWLGVVGPLVLPE